MNEVSVVVLLLSIAMSSTQKGSAITMPTSKEASISSLFAPTGKLRASINLGNPVLASTDPETGQPAGVTIDLARELAKRIGVGLELVVFDSAGKSVDAVTQEQLS